MELAHSTGLIRDNAFLPGCPDVFISFKDEGQLQEKASTSGNEIETRSPSVSRHVKIAASCRWNYRRQAPLSKVRVHVLLAEAAVNAWQRLHCLHTIPHLPMTLSSGFQGISTLKLCTQEDNSCIS